MRFLACMALCAALVACGTTMRGREACAARLDTAWKELDLAKVEGFAGTASYAKAVGLLTSAKTQQTLENFERCADEAERARFYIGEARKGR
jgi:predicted acylesterase/phospholipase RssA